ncbi:hypothetical protein PMI08_01074 [Brevibacillus sp. CF112]|uniref:Ig-like domain-containing protein n=1 Tax=Brevibacillus TaxID=55080 RepID=UPI000271655D|nr:Ig-like domain-containing protein [Brevibacillus sp. CF112]EJL46579.1 hypothetical protein PMI08_01074 [Brevibacillus sp. CF112]
MNKKVTLSLLSATVFASMAASAFAAPTQGVYMGGSVDKFYKLDDLFNLTAEAKKQFVTNLNTANPDGDFNNLVFVDFDGKGAKFSEILAKGTLSKAKRDLTKTDFEGSYVTVNLDGSNGVSYDPRNDAVDVPTGDLKVESVSAINAKQLKVVFNKEVQKGTAEVGTNYTAAPVGGAALDNTAWTPVLQDDNKTVIITLKNGEAFTTTATSYAIGVANVLDADGNQIDDYSQLMTISDTARPTVDGEVTWTDSKHIKVSFTEPVDLTNGGLATVDTYVKLQSSTGANVTPVAGAFAPAADGKSVTIDVSTLTTAGAYKVVVTGLKDFAGNLVSPNPVSKNFTVSTDTTAPTVAEVKAVNAKVIRVTFSEPLAEATNGAGDFFTIKVDGETKAAIGVEATTSDNKTFDVDLSGTKYVAAGWATGLHRIEIADAKDLAGLSLAAPVVKYVDFVGNQPTFKSTAGTLKNIGGTNYIVFEADRTVDVTPAAIATVKYVDVDGVEQTLAGGIASAAVTAYDKDGNGVADGIKLNADNYDGAGAKLPAGQYSLTLDGSKIADHLDSTVKMANTAVTFTIAGSASTTKVNSVVVGSNPSELIVNFSSDVDTSALNVNNYTVEGKVVAKSAKFVGNKKTVYLTLNPDQIEFTSNYTVAVSGIKDASGKAVTAFNASVPLNENVRPTATAKLSDLSTITLTFSEAMDANTIVDATDNAQDFVVYVNGVAKTGTVEAAAAGDTTGTKFTIALAQPLSSSEIKTPIVVKLAAGGDAADVLGNVTNIPSAGVTVTVE